MDDKNFKPFDTSGFSPRGKMMHAPFKKGGVNKCPKCQSENTKMVEDLTDDLHDLCLLCSECGYDERAQKQELKNGK
jgi:DNA-directed RNA polymerase subunit M/transcription elongation factor TFIIS